MLLLQYSVLSLISIVLQCTVRASLLWLCEAEKFSMAYFVCIWDYVMSLASFKLKILLTVSGRMQFNKLLSSVSIENWTSCLMNNHIQDH
jgi:hypothetical protein